MCFKHYFSIRVIQRQLSAHSHCKQEQLTANSAIFNDTGVTECKQTQGCKNVHIKRGEAEKSLCIMQTSITAAQTTKQAEYFKHHEGGFIARLNCINFIVLINWQ